MDAGRIHVCRAGQVFRAAHRRGGQRHPGPGGAGRGGNAPGGPAWRAGACRAGADAAPRGRAHRRQAGSLHRCHGGRSRLHAGGCGGRSRPGGHYAEPRSRGGTAPGGRRRAVCRQPRRAPAHRLHHAFSGRRRLRHHSVQFAAKYRVAQGGAGLWRRQCRRLEAVGVHAAHVGAPGAGAAGRGHAAGVPGRAARRGRQRRRMAAARTGRGVLHLHRQHPRGPHHSAGRGPAPHADGTWLHRQHAGLRGRGPGARDSQDRQRHVPEGGAGLHVGAALVCGCVDRRRGGRAPGGLCGDFAGRRSARSRDPHRTAGHA
ncbi:hypothetical protein D3C72_1295880 [compost metagenome]